MFAFGSRDVDMRLPGFDLVVSAATSRSAGAVSGRDRSELGPQRPKLT
jgi:hypothetical protein